MNLQQTITPDVKEANKLRFIYYIVLCFLVLYFFRSCIPFPKNFGPYNGIVVDMETKEPIEGAIVFFSFVTASGSVGGTVYSYGNALDVFTGKNGKFFVPQTKMSIKFGGGQWRSSAVLLVYKPGYWNFPDGDSNIKVMNGKIDDHHKDRIFNNTTVIIELKKTKSPYEIKKNLSSISPFASFEKQTNLRKLMNIDEVKIGRSQKKTSKW